jgi:hypothetical protein
MNDDGKSSVEDLERCNISVLTESNISFLISRPERNMKIDHKNKLAEQKY